MFEEQLSRLMAKGECAALWSFVRPLLKPDDQAVLQLLLLPPGVGLLRLDMTDCRDDFSSFFLDGSDCPDDAGAIAQAVGAMSYPFLTVFPTSYQAMCNVHFEPLADALGSWDFFHAVFVDRHPCRRHGS